MTERNIHGDNSEPSLDLKNVASERGFVISDNQGGGNCMFFAISEQLELIQGVKLSHKKLRKKVVRYLKKNPTLVSGFLAPYSFLSAIRRFFIVINIIIFCEEREKKS